MDINISNLGSHNGWNSLFWSSVLPLDNPGYPKRVRRSCPKKSYVETNDPEKYNSTQQEQSQASMINYQGTTSSHQRWYIWL